MAQVHCARGHNAALSNSRKEKETQEKRRIERRAQRRESIQLKRGHV